ncbi:MAG: antibiotic biosynthesis monooxygenase [Sporichthyaceae bacterium]
MLLVARLVDVADPDVLAAEAAAAFAALATRPGWVRGRLGRSLDEPGDWVLTCEWEDVGTGRRGLSTGAVRTAIMPLMSRLPHEALTYEIVDMPADC